MKIVDNGSNSPYNVPHQLEETTMLNIKEFAKEIEQFIEVSGDDVSSVVEVDEDNLLEFQHLSLLNFNFSHSFHLCKDGKIELSINNPASFTRGSFLDQNIENCETTTLQERVVIDSKNVETIQEVIEFIYKQRG